MALYRRYLDPSDELVADIVGDIPFDDRLDLYRGEKRFGYGLIPSSFNGSPLIGIQLTIEGRLVWWNTIHAEDRTQYLNTLSYKLDKFVHESVAKESAKLGADRGSLLIEC